MAANIRCIMRAKAPYGQGITKMKVKLTPEQSSTPSLMPETNSVYLSRPTEGTGELMELVGGTVSWNQLCNSSSVTGTSGHKFYLKKSGVESITNTNTFTGLASGTDMVTDLTQLLGSTIADYVYSLEQSQAGSGIAWLKKYDLIDDQYHAYSAPTLQSVEASAHVTVGKNLMNFVENEMVSRGYDCYFPNPIPSAGTYKLTCQNRFGGASNYGAAVVFKNEVGGENVGGFYAGYSFGDTSMEGTTTTITAEQAAAPYITFLARSIGMTFESLKNAFIQIEHGSIATAYEPYTKTTTPLANVTLRGMLKKDADGHLYYEGDTYEWDGTVTRYFGERAYQAGDESLTDAITDGTNTVYKLNTPTTESADPFTAVQTVEDGGTEEFVTTNNVPVGVKGRFANAVPMEGVDSFTVTANDGTSHTYPVTLSEEIYRGYVDMLTGDAISDMASIAEYNGETISEPWLSSLDEYAAGTTPTNGAQVVYPITPEEVTATITGDPSELSGVVSATSTEGTVEWSDLSEIGIKCIMKRKNPFQ